MNMKENKKINEKVWRQEGNVITNGKRTLLIGDYVDYKPYKRKYKGKWIAIGATDGGNLMIMSEEAITTFKLGGKEGILSGEKSLNAICENYALGDNAVFARSLRVEDVEKMFNIKKDFEDETLKICWSGSECYKIIDEKKPEIRTIDFCCTDKFCFLDNESHQWRESINNFEEETITYLKTYSHCTHVNELYNVDKKLIKQICNSTYWLATPCVSRYKNDIRYGLHVMTENLFSTTVSMVSAVGEEYDAERAGVRAVVYLYTDAELEPVTWKLQRNNNEYA